MKRSLSNWLRSAAWDSDGRKGCGPLHLAAHLAVTMCLFLSVATQGQGAGTLELVKKGDARAVVVLPAGAEDDEVLASKEIVDYVRQISGAELQVVRGKAALGHGKKIVIGLSLCPGAENAIKAKGDDPAAFLFAVRKDGAYLAGLSPRGTLYAAYELLEQLGVRWFMPGELGTVVPREADIRLALQETVAVPSFTGRHLSDTRDPAWTRRCRLSGLNAGSHNLPVKIDPEKELELFCTEDGRRTHMIRVSHPEVLRRVTAAVLGYFRKNPQARYISMGPPDGAGFGTDPWDAGDMDPLHGKISVTDRYVKFFNLILDEVQKEFPEAGIAFYAYAQYMRPPIREKPNPRILPVLAPIDLCRFHSVDNPICPERSYMKEVIAGWQALGCAVFYRGYFFNLADQGLPFSMIRQIAEEIPFFHRSGIIGCRVQCMPMWGHHAPSLYLATRLMWNAEADPQAIMDDFFMRFYGPAGPPMQAYFEIMEEAFYQADYHTGNVFDMPHILTGEVMATLDRELIAAARKSPAQSDYAARVALVREAHDYGQANLSMMAAFNDFRFAEAREQHDLAVAIRDRGLKLTPKMFFPLAANGYLRRFWTGAVSSGWERIQEGNEIALPLPDEWLFLLDPLDGGESLGFSKPGMGTNNWLRLKTRSSSWSNQGLRYYKGVAWYRTTATVPARFKGRPLRLWLGGIDDTPTAWINGQPLECLLRGAAPMGRPWEFDATDAVRVGKENVIVIKVVNKRVNELGTGGITGPAMIWAAPTGVRANRSPKSGKKKYILTGDVVR